MKLEPREEPTSGSAKAAMAAAALLALIPMAGCLEPEEVSGGEAGNGTKSSDDAGGNRSDGGAGGGGTESSEQEKAGGAAIDFDGKPTFYVHKSEFLPPEPRVVGFVKNTGDTALDFITVTVTYYDDSGRVVGSEEGYVGVGLAPGERFPFKVIPLSEIDPKEIADWEAVVNADTALTRDSAGTCLTVRGDQGRETGEWDFGTYAVLGEVVNDCDGKVVFTTVAVSFFDASGDLLDVSEDFTSPVDIPPDRSGSFEIVTDREGVTVESYEIFVGGDVE